MANNNPSNSVAIVAIVLLVLVALGGGYLMFGHDHGRDNDIRIDLPDKKH